MSDTTKTADSNAPTSRMISEEPTPKATAAGTPLDLSATFAAVEAEVKRLEQEIAGDRESITRSRARITANEAKLKDAQRLLGARTPKTRARKASK